MEEKLENCIYYHNGYCEQDLDTVAVDLDGRILKYNGWNGENHFGEVEDGAIEGMKQLQDWGYYVIVWTCRDNLDDVAEYLENKGVPFDNINENPHGPETSRKMYADIYIDDRNLLAAEDWDEIIDIMRRRCSG